MMKQQASPSSDTISSPLSSSFKIHNRLMIKPKFNYESDDIFQFRIKRLYHRNFRLNGTIYQFYRGIKIKPLKIVKNMKFLRNLTLTDILEMGTRSLLAISNLMQSLKRTSSLQLKFECIYDWNDPLMNKTLKKILLSNKSHLQSFDLQFCLNDDRHSNGFKLLRLIIKALEPLHNLKKFNLFLEKQPPVLPYEVLQPIQNYSLTEEKYIRIFKHKFQRLRSLQNLNLKCHVPRFSNFQILSQSLKQFCDLQVLELVLDHIHTTKALLKDLHHLKNLQVLILYYNINPLDLLSISMNSPNIKKLIIREHWIYNPSSFNTLAQIPQTTTTTSSLLSLHLDCCLKIVDEDNATFFSKFLGFFGQIRDLKLYLSCEGESYLLNSIAEKINLMKQLKILTLGFAVQTGRQIQRFAECMKDIKQLEKLSFTTKILMGNHEAYRGLHNLIKSNPSLSEIELFCKMMDIECMEEFAKIVKSFHNINKLSIFYRTWYETHVKVHEQVLEGIIKALNKAENIKQASIITSCNYLSHTNCETIGDRLKKKIDLKKNIRQFTFSNQWEIQTPFYNDSLSC